MKLPILFGRRADPSATPLSSAAELERVESEITRLRTEAADARREAEQVAVFDADRAVILDSAANQAEQLVARLLSSLPSLYSRRRTDALKVREADIDQAVKAEAAALRELAEKIRILALAAMNAIVELRKLGVGEVWGGIPVGLSGNRIVKYILPDEKMTPEILGKRIAQDLSVRLDKIAAAGELLKYASRNDRDVVNGDPEAIALTNALRGRLPAFEAPPAAPELDQEITPAVAG